MLTLIASSDTPWWTILPASVSAVGTVLAFAVTYRLFLRGNDDRVRAQANLVYAIQSRPSAAGVVDVLVHNGSELPIWEVEVSPLRAGQLQLVSEQPRSPTILPGKDEPFRLTVRADDFDGPLDPIPRVTFIDNAGRHWDKVGGDLAVRGERRWRWSLQAAIYDLRHRDRAA